MGGYRTLRKLRLHLWVGFIVMLLFAISSRDLDPALWQYTRYIPAMIFMLALIIGCAERSLRKQLGL